MRKPAAFLLVISIPLLLVAAVWQAGRYAALAAEARNLEDAQEEWVQENRKLEAGIWVLASRERAASLAKALGLVKASPEKRLHVDVTKDVKDRSDG
jgi:hypothetical protein